MPRRRRGRPDAAGILAAPGGNKEAIRTSSWLALSRPRHLDWLEWSARHRGDAACRPIRRSGGGSRRMCWPLRQSQRLPHLGVQLGHDVLVIFQELAGILAPLANAFALIAEPRPRLLKNIVVDRDVEQVALARNTFSVEDVELGLAEGRRDFILHHLHPRPRTGYHVAFLDGGNAANVDPHRRIELQRSS